MSGGRLLVLDVDSTLIQQEVIELLAARAGSQDSVAAITERAMRGELDFAASLAERVATLEGLPDVGFAEVAAEVGPHARRGRTRGDRPKHAGWTVALVSGGFEEIVVDHRVAASTSTHFVANRLEVGRRVTSPVAPSDP